MASRDDFAVLDLSGRVRVCSRRCVRCPFGRSEFAPEDFAEQVRRALERGGILACPASMKSPPAAVCRGFFEGYARLSPLLALGRPTDRTVEVGPPTSQRAE
jgi:hypothetical protein